MGSLWLLKEQKLTWSAVTLGLAASVKQPAAIFLPAISAYVVHKNGGRAGLLYFCKAISVFMLIILPFLVSTPKDFVSMYVYLTPSFSQVIHKITPFAAPQTTKLGLWAVIQLIQQKTTINVGWLASIRFPIFITALILPVPLLYRRDYTLGAAYLLPALSFILFSPPSFMALSRIASSIHGLRGCRRTPQPSLVNGALNAHACKTYFSNTTMAKLSRCWSNLHYNASSLPRFNLFNAPFFLAT
jgi:hypothetical protein